jgi:hypothetical protein
MPQETIPQAFEIQNSKFYETHREIQLKKKLTVFCNRACRVLAFAVRWIYQAINMHASRLQYEDVKIYCTANRCDA